MKPCAKYQPYAIAPDFLKEWSGAPLNSIDEMNITPSSAQQSTITVTPELELPSVEEIFAPGRSDPRVATPDAWTDPNSIAVELADRECARLIANGLFDPPITEEEIDKYVRRFNVSKREAELEIRRQRHAD